jgi:hypothetical protein
MLRRDVRVGAMILRAAQPYLPVDVHMPFEDPSVGGRPAVALAAADGRTFIGPTNRLLSPPAAAAGGIVKAAEIRRSPFRLEAAPAHPRPGRCCPSDATTTSPAFAVIGGDPGTIPSLVRFDHTDTQGAARMCSGTVIAQNIIQAAAHCRRQH